MTNVQVRDIPDDVLADLKELAAERGKSLQGYLRDLLFAQAGVARNRRLFDQVSADLAGLPPMDDDAAELIRQGRAERDKQLGADW